MNDIINGQNLFIIHRKFFFLVPRIDPSKDNIFHVCINILYIRYDHIFIKNARQMRDVHHLHPKPPNKGLERVHQIFS